MKLRLKQIRLFLLMSIAACLSLGAAELPDELEAKRDSVMQVMRNEGYTPELLLPRLSFYLSMLCNRNNPQGRVIAENADSRAVALSPDGHYCAFVLNDFHSIKIYDIRSGNVLQTLNVFHPLYGNECVDCLAFSPDGQRLWAGSFHNICVWNFITGELIKTLPLE